MNMKKCPDKAYETKLKVLKNPLSQFCVGCLQLDLGPALNCVVCIPSETLGKKTTTRFSFVTSQVNN